MPQSIIVDKAGLREELRASTWDQIPGFSLSGLSPSLQQVVGPMGASLHWFDHVVLESR